MRKRNDDYMLSKIKGFVELTRIEHGILYGIAVLIGILLVTGIQALFTVSAILGFLTALFIEMGAFSLNDYIDVQADIINKRIDRPLVRGDLKRESAFAISLVCFLIGNIIAIFISPECFIIAAAFSLLSIMYNSKFKRYAIIGNIFIGITMALPFIFGALIAGAVNDAILVLAGMVFIIGLGREMMKDIEDMKGDKAVGAKTLPIQVGPKKTAYSIAACYIIGVFLSILPIFSFFKGKQTYLLILIVDLIFVYVMVNVLKKQDSSTLKSARKITLIGSALSLLAFFLAAL
ncbi:MAG: UbiA family prenyltransferase [Candidatus Micrarchaeia archaeon]